MADVNINLFKKIEENTTETDGFPEGYLIASVNGKVQGINPDDLYEKFDWALDFLDQQVLDTFSPFDNWLIDSIMNINGFPTINIEVNGSPYVLGTPIYVGQSFKVTVSIPSVILLKCTQL